ncbi:hypothetical protein, partial [Acinetobacter baumannii]|uniref:hypothetical protein n=1 Tax=Acinetobacter baumannii TaxID=470 RepID=UPI003318CC5E
FHCLHLPPEEPQDMPDRTVGARTPPTVLQTANRYRKSCKDWPYSECLPRYPPKEKSPRCPTRNDGTRTGRAPLLPGAY